MAANTFYIAGNMTFDLRTGEKKDILTLVNNEIDATFFKKKDADLYFNFVSVRAPNVVWTIEPTRLRGQGDLFVIKGVQSV